MSLSSIKAKETKGKRNTLPKLKTILANPYKSKCSSLNETEFEDLCQILDLAIKRSGLAPSCFAKVKGICIGLESVLRSINSGRIACVFLSLSIKPYHVVQLVAQNVNVKCATASVYALPQLEQQTDKLFGIRAVAFSLPRPTEDLCVELQEWISIHKKIIKEKRENSIVTKKRTGKKQKINRVLEEHAIDKVEIFENIPTQKNSEWSGDFIPFSSLSRSTKKVNLNLDQDKSKLLGVLSQMTGDVPVSLAKGNAELDIDVVEVSEKNDESVSSNKDYDSDDFLESYKPLKVCKIIPNPNKKPKKKRKNKNKK